MFPDASAFLNRNSDSDSVLQFEVAGVKILSCRRIIMNKRRVSGLWLIVLKGTSMYFMLAAAIVFACPSAVLAGPGEYLPAYIYGMEQKKVISGKEASRIINRMHRGDVATNFDYIAEYRSEAGSAGASFAYRGNPPESSGQDPRIFLESLGAEF